MTVYEDSIGANDVAAVALSSAVVGTICRPRSTPFVVKRAVDVAVAVVGLVLAAVPLLVCVIVIRCTSPGRALYSQQRVGRDGVPYRMWKLRTMVDGADAMISDDQIRAAGPFFKVEEDRRVTRVGTFLRKYSIDEIPQLWNVLRGEMSLVGPRPQVRAEVDAYEPWMHERLTVRPGLTGAWQVAGRSDLDVATSMSLDIDYVRTWSVWLDVRILAATPGAVLRGRGAC